jgi:hypothetical protein
MCLSFEFRKTDYRSADVHAKGSHRIEVAQGLKRVGENSIFVATLSSDTGCAGAEAQCLSTFRHD